MDHPGQTGCWSERTDADLSSLLSELSRVYKAAAFYGPDDPATTTFAERACRAWQSDLARAGPLELEVTEMGFRLHDAPGLFANAPLGEIAGGLARVGVQRIRFTEVLSAQSLGAFVASLLDLVEARRPPSQLGIEIDGEICRVLDSDGPEGFSNDLQLERGPVSLGSFLLGRRTASENEKPEVEGDPLAEPATGPGTDWLLLCLTELDRCTDDSVYLQLAAKVADAALALDDGLSLETSRAMLVLADHAGARRSRW